MANNEFSWDVFGYYLPLPATFIYHDAMLNDVSWVEMINTKYHLTDTLYQISRTPDGGPMYFFFLGMSMIYLPFFLIGHFFAGAMGYVQDGFTAPYEYAVVAGGLMYTILGLFFTRRILLHFFRERTVVFLLIILVFGTNFILHNSIKNLETVNFLFFFSAVLVWCTMQWHLYHRRKHMIVIGLSLVFMALIKPSEVLFITVPILWGISSFGQLKEKFQLFWKKRMDVLLTICICLCIGFVQLWYWKTKTGLWVYDSYINPGVGLDLLSPHIVESLFSYRKGWLLYTPIMLFALVGFYFLRKKRKDLFAGLLIPFLLAYYIIASWTEYWYGAAFSNRPVIAWYPLLLIPMGYFWERMDQLHLGKKSVVYGLTGLFIALNIFQYWQLTHGILDPYRTTKAYYWRTFLKTTVSEEDKKTLLVKRDFSGTNTILYPELYGQRVFLKEKNLPTTDEVGANLEFAFTQKVPFEELTTRDHVYMEFEMDYELPDSSAEVYLAAMIQGKAGHYDMHYFPIVPSEQNFRCVYLPAEVRNKRDEVKFFVWNPSFSKIEIRDFRVTLFERKIRQ